MAEITRDITCIECPTGCAVTAGVEDGRVVWVEGFGCRRGHDYAISEIESPVRILTTTVAAHGLSVRMVPVRTSAAIPRHLRGQAMQEIRAVTVRNPVKLGQAVLTNLLGLGVDVLATRSVD